MCRIKQICIVVRNPDNPVSLAPPQVKLASIHVLNAVSAENISANKFTCQGNFID